MNQEMAPSNPDTEVVSGITPLATIESMTITTPIKDAALTVKMAKGIDDNILVDEESMSYEVGFFFDDLGLASYHYVHAKSTDEALGKAMVEHIADPNQRKQLITSFTIVEDYDELDEFNDVRKNKVSYPDSYDVTFHHIFHIKECVLAFKLEECMEESLYTIEEAESEADAVNKALKLHLIDSSDWVINSFDVKKLD